MNSKPLISIIIPLYNCGEYISRCLNSLLEQTYKNIEIIVIDDGSSDNGGEICRKIAQTDNRIKYIYQDNSGVSEARNNGLKHAQGEWIGFCDADDYVETDMYEYLLNLAVNHNADIAQCGTVMEFNENHLITFCPENDILVKSFPTIKRNLMKYYNNSVWSKVFNHNCIDNLIFDVKYPIGEDLLFSIKAALQSNNVVLGSRTKYHYVQRGNSACYTCVFDKNIASHREVLNELSRLLNGMENLKDFYFDQQLKNDFDICSKFVRYQPQNSVKLIEDVRNELKNNLKYIFFSENFSPKEKLKAHLIVKTWNLYSILIRGKKERCLKIE